MQLIKKIRFYGLVIKLLFTLGGVSYPIASFAAEPRLVVDNFHAVLLTVMKTSSTNNIMARYKALEPAVENAFNLQFMTRITVGSRWRKARKSEKSFLIQAFKRMSVGTYASRFNNYSGQNFRTLKVRAGPTGTRLVDTLLKNPVGNDVRLTYVTRKFSEDWKIIDVLLDRGISEMAVRVSEYRRILRSYGLPGLTRALNKKASKLLKN